MLHFDSYQTICKLKACGFTEEQAAGLTDAVQEINFSHLATKEDVASVRTELKQEIVLVRTELSAVKTELKQDIASVRTELKQDITAVRTELKQDIINLDHKIQLLESRIIIKVGGMMMASVAALISYMTFFLKLH